MEYESFESLEIAEKLNTYFIPVKVDREERPDIDSIYMSVCQAMTGSGGWPLTVFLTPEKKPFYVGTYFPKRTRHNMIGLMELLETLIEKWKITRGGVFDISERITAAMIAAEEQEQNLNIKREDVLIADAYGILKTHFDSRYGGFYSAPKFPSPHNLLFLLEYYKSAKLTGALEMVEKTLVKMYEGGIFDHIGGGFSRYSTDEKWLVPHFEKMLYDNAMLIMAYSCAYTVTGNELYNSITEKVFKYLLTELTNTDEGFYCAQDADSDGIEGKYYVFTPVEVIQVLGEHDGAEFCKHFGITVKGNFEGKSIPNLSAPQSGGMEAGRLADCIEKMYEYRKKRTKLHLDDKILTSWNSLMIAALARAYLFIGNEEYLNAALRAYKFIEKNLSEGDRLFTSYRNSKRSETAFLDDYAFYIWSLIELYNATLEKKYILRASSLTHKLTDNFWDEVNGGFYLYGKDSEQFFLRPKEVYDGALPSGNSVMMYNLLMLSKILKDRTLGVLSNRHMGFMLSKTGGQPHGSLFFMYALLNVVYPPKEIVCVLKDEGSFAAIMKTLDKNAIVTIFNNETEDYKLLNGETTFYVCEGHMCLPPYNYKP